MAGRPVIGAVGGILVGLGGAVFLQQAGIYPLTAVSLYGFPVLGIALGILVARWAPLGGGGA